MEWVVWTLATGWLIWGIWWSVDHNRLKADRDRYRRMAEWLAIQFHKSGGRDWDDWLQAAADAVTGEGDG